MGMMNKMNEAISASENLKQTDVQRKTLLALEQIVLQQKETNRLLQKLASAQTGKL